MADHDAGLRALPGVSPYTAAAVASFAYGQRVAVDDTNVRRVLSRWEGEALQGARLRSAAEAALSDDAAAWNQAVMELGAVVCRPMPDCAACPVRRWCIDPTLYRPPARQAPFRGSDREVRGAVLRALSGRAWRTHHQLAAAVGHDPARVGVAVRSLAADGLVERRRNAARIAA
jgi:A/G-specific adenine glycosylase